MVVPILDCLQETKKMSNCLLWVKVYSSSPETGGRKKVCMSRALDQGESSTK